MRALAVVNRIVKMASFLYLTKLSSMPLTRDFLIKART